MLYPLGSRRQMGGGLGTSAGGGGFSLPYTMNPSGDGVLPSPWEGATFAVSGGKITNTPGTTTLSLTDNGLEATYTAGKCNTLTMSGTPTVAESADVHEGSKAQQFTAALVNNTLYQSAGAGVAGAWYRYHRWGKRTAGAGDRTYISAYQAASIPGVGNKMNDLIDNAAYEQNAVGWISTSTNANLLYAAAEDGALGGDTVIVDDGYFYRLTAGQQFALLPAQSRLATVKVQPDTLQDATLSGLVAWYDATGYIMAYFFKERRSTYILVGLIKNVGGTYTQLINQTAVSKVTDAWLELRPVDNDTVALYYNNAQVSTNKDVADCPGSQAGLLHMGGSNNIKNFFWG